MPEDDPSAPGSGGRIGSLLGGLARRVGAAVADVAGAPQFPQELRPLLKQARALRLAGEWDASLEALAAGGGEPKAADADPWLSGARTLAQVHRALAQDLDAGEEPAVVEPADGAAEPIAALAQAVAAADVDAAQDGVRKAERLAAQLPQAWAGEVRFLAAAIEGRARARAGQLERALRALRRAERRRPEGLKGALAEALVAWAVDLLLRRGHLAEAGTWLSSMTSDGDEPVEEGTWALAARAQVAAVRGDHAAARRRVEELAERAPRRARILGAWVDLAALAPVEEALAAVEELAGASAEGRRLWALAHLARADPSREPNGGAPEAPPPEAILDALVAAHDAAAPPMRDAHLAEAAHAAFRLGTGTEGLRDRVQARLAAGRWSAPEEVRLWGAYLRAEAAGAHSGPSADRDPDFDPGPPPQVREGLPLEGPQGPDPASPLRDVRVAHAVRAGVRCLCAAAYARARGAEDAAGEHLLRALVEAPGLPGARAGLAGLVPKIGGPHLEDLLDAATRALSAIPTHTLAAPPEVGEAAARVMAARERLARPLVIAVMGAFSAGKSTFVNALLGAEVAPVGTLPTTSTINVFHRGAKDRAHVVRRDGAERPVRGEVGAFLRGLDADAAAEIHHVEIERQDLRLGDAAVVDTPGLDSLDPYHEQVARRYLEDADAVVWLLAATAGLSGDEKHLLADLRARGRAVLAVVNKVDVLRPGEAEELLQHLRAELGDLVLEVLPLSAQQALAARLGGEPSPDDPFAPVADALERGFLRRAREIKREATVHELLGALRGAQAGVERALADLAEPPRGAAAGGDDPGAASLSRFRARLAEALAEVDDPLARTCLALGLAHSGRGPSREPGPEDLDVLAEVVREGAERALAAAMGAVHEAGDEVAAHLLARRFVPVLRGLVLGRTCPEVLRVWVRAGAEGARGGEAGLRQALRGKLQGLANEVAALAEQLVDELEFARERAARAASLRRRATRARLELGARAALDQLIEAAQTLERADPPDPEGA